MKKTLLFSFIYLLSVVSSAANVDSISTDTTGYKELNELVVEGQTSFVTDNGMMFIPDKQAKKCFQRCHFSLTKYGNSGASG